MYLTGVGTEQQVQASQPYAQTGRQTLAVQKKHEDDEGLKKVNSVSSTTQDRVTLSQEAKTLALPSNPKGGSGTFQDNPSPFDR